MIYFLSGFVIYMFVGYAVLALIDKDLAILRWVHECPVFLLAVLIQLLWPFLVVFILYMRRKNERSSRG